MLSVKQETPKNERVSTMMSRSLSGSSNSDVSVCLRFFLVRLSVVVVFGKFVSLIPYQTHSTRIR